MDLVVEIIVTILGFLLSCVASLIIWWLTTVKYTPNIKLCHDIAKCTQNDNSFKYYFKVINLSSRDVYDIKVTCRLFYRDTYLGIMLPEIPILTARNITLKNHDSFDKFGYERTLPFNLISIKPKRIAGFKDKVLIEKRRNKTLSLEDFCVEGMYMEISILAFDGYSGSRKYMKHLVFSHNDVKSKIVKGRFYQGEDFVRSDSAETLEEYGDNC